MLCLIRIKNIIKQSEELTKELNYNGDINYNSTLLALYGESTYGNVMSSMGGMMIIMLSLVSIGCIIVIYNSFAISVMERKKGIWITFILALQKNKLRNLFFMKL